MIAAAVLRLYEVWKYRRLFWKHIEVAAKAESGNSDALIRAMSCAVLLQRLGYTGTESQLFERVRHYGRKE